MLETAAGGERMNSIEHIIEYSWENVKTCNVCGEKIKDGEQNIEYHGCCVNFIMHYKCAKTFKNALGSILKEED